ncbi:hypothetical protein BJY04DRAFT_222735 [Aspergillus karnatakaensis]|uniref:uncharacterized protein n=1 Tax=Aspergillus karnatakaensis TaxID=1810916 RepID=UPI003CCD9F6C
MAYLGAYIVDVNIIYNREKGPKSVMNAAQENAQQLYQDEEKNDLFWAGNFKFMWIHLPANTAIDEAKLIRKFIDSKIIMKGKRDNHSRASSSLRNEYVKRTAGLLSNVRDMRDELNMLKPIVEDQHAVQRGPGESECTAAGHIINDPNRVDTARERTYKAVNATLTLEQNVVALSQCEETIQQGRILMAFVVTAIIFLPVSFLVSLLAADIAAFPHNYSVNLQYTAGWGFAKICTSISFYYVVKFTRYLAHLLLQFVCRP